MRVQKKDVGRSIRLSNLITACINPILSADYFVGRLETVHSSELYKCTTTKVFAFMRMLCELRLHLATNVMIFSSQFRSFEGHLPRIQQTQFFPTSTLTQFSTVRLCSLSVTTVLP